MGICYDFARNQWVARYGVTVETFPLNPGPLDSKMPKFEAVMLGEVTELSCGELELYRMGGV